ncbi:hypothetical protein F5Y11DRAFT_319690 [Daldinia sp. FL1419]|nr:hypothetical protein F5Y11DRAFT_319690 [Daldinia sp. FL1419]
MMWPCDFAGCQNPAVRTLGSCVICNSHLCSKHIQDTFHHCPTWRNPTAYFPAVQMAEENELRQLISKINFGALAARASRLRNGRTCSVHPARDDEETQGSVLGGMNYHIGVYFDDGIEWIARVRRSNAASPPPALRDYFVQSEAATLKFLERTSVSAPKLIEFALETPDNPIGVGYILMERLRGKPLLWSLATQEQKRKVMDHIADTFIELRKYPFDSLGSLNSPGDLNVGPFAWESLTEFPQSEMRTLGPFSSLEEYHKASIQLILDQIVREEMYSQRPVDAYLVHRFLLDLIPFVLPSSTKHEDQKFYLKHGDDKGNHILVDDNFNVTGIIDWEWAHTASPVNAFNSPISFLPVHEFYEGRNNLGYDEDVFGQILEWKGHQDLADVVRKGRVQHRFAFCCGYDLVDWDGFVGLFQALRNAVKVDEGVDWDAWKAIALDRYKEDAGLQHLLLNRNVDIS